MAALPAIPAGPPLQRFDLTMRLVHCFSQLAFARLSVMTFTPMQASTHPGIILFDPTWITTRSSVLGYAVIPD